MQCQLHIAGCGLAVSAATAEGSVVTAAVDIGALKAQVDKQQEYLEDRERALKKVYEENELVHKRLEGPVFKTGRTLRSTGETCRYRRIAGQI